MSKQITIGCVSMTHLGLIHSVAFAEKGFNIICYDDEKNLINQLQNHTLPVNEPQLNELVAKNSSSLHFTNDIHQLKQCDLVFIACDVPTDDQGNSNLAVIDKLIEKVTPMLSANASLIILSQVPPGFTRQITLKNQIKAPLSPSTSPGLTAGSSDPDSSSLFYQVETLVFGRAVERALFPERYIIGTSDPTQNLPEAYQKLLSSFDCPILKMRYESAELAKISINMFLVSSVTTTNTLAEICEKIGADWEEIAPSLRLDKRIGQYAYLAPGLGLSGGNLERDLNTVIKLGKANSTDTGVVSAWLQNSQYRRDWVLRCLQDGVLSRMKNPLICILGLAYKPDTHSVKNSPSIALINQLKNYQIKAHDPVVKDQGLMHVTQYQESLSAIKDADVVIIMTPWTEYRNLSIELIKTHMRGKTIIDPYHVLKGCVPSEKPQVNYCTLGQRSSHQEHKEFDYA